jgi:hypothetical protein
MREEKYPPSMSISYPIAPRTDTTPGFVLRGYENVEDPVMRTVCTPLYATGEHPATTMDRVDASGKPCGVTVVPIAKPRNHRSDCRLRDDGEPMTGRFMTRFPDRSDRDMYHRCPETFQRIVALYVCPSSVG